MRSLFRLSLIVFVGILVSRTHGSAADEKLVAKTPNGGTITHSNLYENPTLGVSIPLEGSWQFFEKEDQKRMGVLTTPSSTANCAGPLCNEAFNVEIITKPALLSPSGTISFLAFKLEPKYLDRQKYPLYRFADAMMRGSLPPDQSTAEPMREIKLGGHTLYRQMVKQGGSEEIRNIGYVFENKGYVVLAVTSAPNAENEQKVQAAMEKIKFE